MLEAKTIDYGTFIRPSQFLFLFGFSKKNIIITNKFHF